MLFLFRCAFDIQFLLRPENIGGAHTPIARRMGQMGVEIGPFAPFPTPQPLTVHWPTALT
jgi:hypothetical protein